MVGRTRVYIRVLPILFSFNEMNISSSMSAFPLRTRLHGKLYELLRVRILSFFFTVRIELMKLRHLLFILIKNAYKIVVAEN
jgi:hypothetical protein